MKFKIIKCELSTKYILAFKLFYLWIYLRLKTVTQTKLNQLHWDSTVVESIISTIILISINPNIWN